MFKAYLISMLPYFRNRLRCPRCSAVGTWKPHGTVFDRQDRRKVVRWLCKWCGLYRGPEGQDLQCELPNHCNPNEFGWQLRPKLQRLGAKTPENYCKPADPWRVDDFSTRSSGAALLH